MVEILNNYTPVGDNITLVLCIVYLMLKKITYSKKDIRLQVFTWSIHQVTAAAATRLIYYIIYSITGFTLTTYYLNFFCFLCLTLTFTCYARYICEIFDMGKKEGWHVGRIILIFPLSAQFVMLLLPLFNNLLNITTSEQLENFAFHIFSVIYVYCILAFVYILTRYKKFIMVRLWVSFVAVTTLSVIVVIISSLNMDISFLTCTFLLPLIAAYNLLHNNPFNIELGTLDANAFENYLTELKDNNERFTLCCLYFNDTNTGDCIKDIRKEFYNNHNELFKKNYIFKLNDKRYVFVVKNGIISAESRTEYLKELKLVLDKVYRKYKVEYKITLITSNKALDKTKKYIEFNKYLEQKNGINTIYYSVEDDYNKFLKAEYITLQLYDIVKENNLNDERVLVYCQPVYNTKKHKYDSAEALMRLNLPNLGMVFPDQFISIAEQEECIHMLSLIILNKACKKIKEFEKKGIDFSRISINFSVMELKQEDFCADVVGIIARNEIPYNKIAIELTESKNEDDFRLIKDKVKELRDLGMYIYIDDFGSGYSNFDRIMQLPANVIKFDRSLVIMSGKDNNYRHMVKNFSQTFNELGYHVLFEGIETKEDEDMCENMGANYLQGYKYSKPIPIEELEDFTK